MILATSHGRRSIDVLREYDPSKATLECKFSSHLISLSCQRGIIHHVLTPIADVQRIEASIPKQFGADAVEIPGSRALLEDLEKAGARWAIVTSGTRGLVNGWLDVMKLAHPKNLVVAEDVKIGKPDPEGYLLGFQRLGLAQDATALVFEDAPAGVRAGKAAGFKVVGLATTHTVQQLREAGAHWIVRDMKSVVMKDFDRKNGRVSVEISNALVN